MSEETKKVDEVAKAITKIAFYICVAFVLNVLIQVSGVVMGNFIESTKEPQPTMFMLPPGMMPPGMQQQSAPIPNGGRDIADN